MADDANGPERPQLPSDEDIQARFAKIREELSAMELPDLPDDEALRNKIRQVTSPIPNRGMPEVPELPDMKFPERRAQHKPSGTYDYKSLGIGMSVAYSMVGSMVVGFGLGWLFDRFTGSNVGMIFGSLGGCVLGIMSVMFLINRNSGSGK